MSLTLEQTHALQTQLTDHIRDPELNAPPSGIEDRRLKIYRDLFYKNIEGFMQRGFPITRQLFDDISWQKLIRGFMQDHLCGTPYFTEITQEFVIYVQARTVQASEPAFLVELVHYEWVEVALELADIDLADLQVDPNGDLMDGRPQVSPLLMSLAYQFPVHLIGPDFQPSEPPAEPTYLMVYRNRDDRVKFMQSNQNTARLLVLLEDASYPNGRAVLGQLAADMQAVDSDIFVTNGQITLNKLLQLDIILGTKVP